MSKAAAGAVFPAFRGLLKTPLFVRPSRESEGFKMLLEGKNALVTGARRGIGRAVVQTLAESGANIWACAREPDEAFEADMAGLAVGHGPWVRPVYFDLADEAQIKEGLKSILKEKLAIDILVNVAGVAHGGMLAMTSISRLRQVFEVNFFAQVLLMQLVSKQMMRQRSGSIVNVASVGGIEANPGYLAYGSSKAALIWTTRSVSKELAPFNIRVNAVAPGLTDTRMGHYREEEELEKTLARTPLRRMAHPQEIADAVLYLVSGLASYVTGHVLVVDGGRTS